MDHSIKKTSWYIKAICFVFSICFFLGSLAATIYLDLWGHVWKDFLKLMVLPGPLITDYFMLGNIASAFLHAGMCGMAFTLLMIFLKAECRPSYLAGYFLYLFFTVACKKGRKNTHICLRNLLIFSIIARMCAKINK